MNFRVFIVQAFLAWSAYSADRNTEINDIFAEDFIKSQFDHAPSLPQLSSPSPYMHKFDLMCDFIAAGNATQELLVEFFEFLALSSRSFYNEANMRVDDFLNEYDLIKDPESGYEKSEIEEYYITNQKKALMIANFLKGNDKIDTVSFLRAYDVYEKANNSTNVETYEKRYANFEWCRPRKMTDLDLNAQNSNAQITEDVFSTFKKHRIKDDRILYANDQAFLEIQKLGDDNQCAFFCLDTNRIDGINLINQARTHMPQIDDIIRDEIYNMFIQCEDISWIDNKEAIEEIKRLREKSSEENKDVLKSYACAFIDTYLDFIQTKPVMLEVCPGDKHPTVMDILAALQGYSLVTYIQESSTEDGYIDYTKLKMYHEFDPTKYGFTHPNGFKPLYTVNTSFFQKRISFGTSCVWRNHFNVLVPRR